MARIKPKRHELSTGIALVEMIIALAISSIFLAAFVALIQTLSIYLSSQNDLNPKKDGDGSQIEQEYLKNILSNLVEVLEQPGVSDTQLSAIVANASLDRCISSSTLESTTDPNNFKQPLNSIWLTSIKTDLKIFIASKFPSKYKFCLSLLDSNSQASPMSIGPPKLYVIFAVPEGGATLTHQPRHQIFCRPSPLCPKF